MIDELLLQHLLYIHHCLQFAPKKISRVILPSEYQSSPGGEKGKRMDEGAIGVTSLSTVISITDEIASAPLLDPKQT